MNRRQRLNKRRLASKHCKIKFLNKPDVNNLTRAVAYGQKSLLCKTCGVCGPWDLRDEHICNLED
jgi:hypothetical protein